MTEDVIGLLLFVILAGALFVQIVVTKRREHVSERKPLRRRLRDWFKAVWELFW